MLIRLLVCACAFFGALILGVTYLPWFNKILFSINNFSFTGNLLVACAVLCVAYSAQGKGK
jgi:cell division septal protein FtsQ